MTAAANPPDALKEPLIFLSAGEASGERYGAALMEAIRRRLAGAQFFGLGGARMAELGFRQVVRAEDVAHMGITEVVRHAPYIYGQFQRLKRAIAAERPALAVLIDFPDVNLRLAEQLHRHQIPVVYFVSPQLWAWKKRRIRRVQRFVDRMLVIFPFEEPFYRERGVAAEFVGHPLADLAMPEVTREEFARQHGLDASKPWVALLPGSRQREVHLNLPTMLQAATILDSTTSGDTYQYLLPVAPTLAPETVAAMSAMQAAAVKPVLVDDARAALFHARGSVVASGTATVEAALAGNPFVVVYRLSKVSYAIARRFVTVPHVAMANLIAGRRVAPELIQDEFTAAKVVAALAPLLAEGLAREEAMAGLREIRERLGRKESQKGEQGGAIERAARICIELLRVELLAGGPPSLSSNATGNAKASNSTAGNATGVSNARRAPEGSAEPAGTYQA
jgi:lipid-A-disaccharide synthase